MDTLMLSGEPVATRQDHELIDLLADAHGYTDEQLADAHWHADHPPAVGSPAWVEDQAELHLMLEQAERENEEARRQILAERRDSRREP